MSDLLDGGDIRPTPLAEALGQRYLSYALSTITARSLPDVPRADAGSAGHIMVVVEAEGGRVALLVDELLGQQQVVVKNLESNYRKVPDVSGATILGDGRVALILDVGSLVRQSRHCAP